MHGQRTLCPLRGAGAPFRTTRLPDIAGKWRLGAGLASSIFFGNDLRTRLNKAEVTTVVRDGGDDPRIAQLGQFTPEGELTPGYGDHYLFLVGRDDCHSILHYLIPRETMVFKFNMFGYDDDELNADIIALMKNPNVRVQASLDRSQAGGKHEKEILALDETHDPDFYNSFVILESATHQISHTKGGCLIGLGMGFEGSMNWSDSGEGTGVSLKPSDPKKPGFKAQNNTLLVSTNPVFLSRFNARLDSEHLIGLAQHSGPTS